MTLHSHRHLLAMISLALSSIPTSDAIAQVPTAVARQDRSRELDMSLVEAVALGLRSNWTIRALYIQRVAERYDLWIAEQRFIPRLSAAGTGELDRINGVSSRSVSLGASGAWLAPTGATVDFSWNASGRTRDQLAGVSQSRNITVVQPLLRGGGIAINKIPIRLARLQDEISRLTVRNTVSSIITGIVGAYRGLIQARDQVALAEAALERSRSQLRVNQALVGAGRMAQADLIQNEADIASQDLALLQSQRNADNARLALLRLLALDLRTPIGKLDTLRPERVLLDPGKLTDIALAHRVEILTQRRSIEQANLNLTLARNNRLWDLSAVGMLDDSRAPGNAGLTGRSSASAVGLRLSIPLFDPGRDQGVVAATTAVRTSELQLENLTQQVEADVRDSVAQVDSNWLQLQAADRARDLASQALTSAKKKLQVGRASNFEVLTFEANLRASEAQRISAGVAYLNSLTTLDQQLGTTPDTWRIDLNEPR